MLLENSSWSILFSIHNLPTFLICLAILLILLYTHVHIHIHLCPQAPIRYAHSRIHIRNAKPVRIHIHIDTFASTCMCIIHPKYGHLYLVLVSHVISNNFGFVLSLVQSVIDTIVSSSCSRIINSYVDSQNNNLENRNNTIFLHFNF